MSGDELFVTRTEFPIIYGKFSPTVKVTELFKTGMLDNELAAVLNETPSLPLAPVLPDILSAYALFTKSLSEIGRVEQLGGVKKMLSETETSNLPSDFTK